MNGIHDMGGMHGFGPVSPEADEPVFHHSWEGRVLAMTFSMSPWARGRDWPSFRFVLESLPPADYLRMSYYERWHAMNVSRLLGSDLLTEAEIASGRADPDRAKPQLMDQPSDAPNEASEIEVEPGFRVGDPVRARNVNPRGHTRLPRYVRGKVGTVIRDHGLFDLQDTDEAGQRLGGPPEHVYSVRFAARELWGDGASGREWVSVDLWEQYLERP